MKHSIQFSTPFLKLLIFTMTRQQGKELSGFRIVFAHSKVSKREPTVFFFFFWNTFFYTWNLFVPSIPLLKENLEKLFPTCVCEIGCIVLFDWGGAIKYHRIRIASVITMAAEIAPSPFFRVGNVFSCSTWAAVDESERWTYGISLNSLLLLDIRNVTVWCVQNELVGRYWDIHFLPLISFSWQGMKNKKNDGEKTGCAPFAWNMLACCGWGRPRGTKGKMENKNNF